MSRNFSGETVWHYHVLHMLTGFGGALCVSGKLNTLRGHGLQVFSDNFDSSQASLKKLDEWRAIVNAELNAAPASSNEPTAVLLAGPPASGKSSTFRTAMHLIGLDADRFFCIDPDKYKDILLIKMDKDGSLQNIKNSIGRERRIANRHLCLLPREFSSIVHHESSAIASHALESAMDLRLNIVIDGILSNARKANDLIGHLIDNRYTVIVIPFSGTKKDTLRRTFRRWASGRIRALKKTSEEKENSSLGGRWVPVHVIDDLYFFDHSTPLSESTVQLMQKEWMDKISIYRINDLLGDAPATVDAVRN